MMTRHGDSFTSFLEENSLRQSIDKLYNPSISSSKTNHRRCVPPIVEKVRTLITRFIAKCRESSLPSSSSSVVDISNQLYNFLKRHSGGECSGDRRRENDGCRETNLN